MKVDLSGPHASVFVNGFSWVVHPKLLIAISFVCLFFGPPLFFALLPTHNNYVVMADPVHVFSCFLLLVLSIVLGAVFFAKKRYILSFINIVSVISMFQVGADDPVRTTAIFVVGVSIALSIISLVFYFKWGSLFFAVLGFFFSLPFVLSSVIWIFGHTLFRVEVSETVLKTTDSVDVRVSGVLGMPVGNLTVYMFPLDSPMAEEGHESSYYAAERDARTTSAHAMIPYPVFSKTVSMVASNQEWECGGGDICSGVDGPLFGDFRVGVAVPNPFYSWNTILVLGPVISVGTSEEQRVALVYADESVLLHARLCDTIEARKKSSWPFMEERLPCGGFIGAKHSIDPDALVWNRMRKAYDKRPPLVLQDGMLCLVDKPVAPYTGYARVCMPLEPQPNEERPDPSTITMELEWSGSLLKFSQFGDRGVVANEIKKRHSFFFENDAVQDVRIQFAGAQGWVQNKNVWQALFVDKKTSPTAVLASVDPDGRICLFGHRRDEHVPDFSDASNWTLCSMVLEAP